MTKTQRVIYWLERLRIFCRRAGQRDMQYGDDTGIWRGRISPSLAWVLAGLAAENNVSEDGITWHSIE